ncbi:MULTISPECIES: DUF2637 domain-containing protein [Streptomyces]|uniref:DUF2637 domain-containing protein n=1 Tax=Streptomyces ramulosus TaxID=47762 RepID=A0ABW1FQS2_9ACTN
MPGARISGRQMTVLDYGAVGALATVGFTLSYDALRQVAVAIHIRPTLTYLFPVVVDGFIAYGVRALVLLRNGSFGARLYAWGLFFLATGASLWANALNAITLNRGQPSGPSGPSGLYLADSVVGALSMVAPLALAGSVHLWIIMARAAESSVPDQALSSAVPPRDGTSPRPARFGLGRKILRTVRKMGSLVAPRRSSNRRGALPQGQGEPVPEKALPSEPSVQEDAQAMPTDAPSVAGGQGGPGRRTAVDEQAAPGSSTVSDSVPQPDDEVADEAGMPVPDRDGDQQDRELLDEWMVEVLPIARDASRAAGRISRSAVQEAVRAKYAISNSRLGDLVAQLKEEEKAKKKGGQRVPARHADELW